MSSTAILITNYNMPERTDALCEHIEDNVRCDYDLFVVDNGSDIMPPSRFTTEWLEKNVQTTGGWLEALKCADAVGREYSYYWFLITSAEFMPASGDVLSPMVDFMDDDPEAVGVHPALSRDSVTAWTQLWARPSGGFRRTWMIDNIASLYRADWFNEIGRFDPALKYGWGIDLETSWRARAEGRSLWVCDVVRMRKVNNIGYTMGRMNMTSIDRTRLAGENMESVLRGKYGVEWMTKMYNDNVQESWL